MLNENQEQTRKLALGCSKYSFEVVDKAKLTSFEDSKKYWSIKVKSLDLF
ncbi:hypothetical protein RLC58_04935 [Streptococcus pneumoniae]|nr:hypothetical protein [Streptococcus pneumoniae]MDS3059117.1 hypothetical protein [Streptococcus pneumoniae]MDS3802914.1 hypothetical protein [Streptococcus pneumoniae]MDS4774052.1 hypothetical protein [Streptococcus pneumoniae]MDS4957082.1 hypothetical protein [Streptococcus pneumoniae]